MKTTYFSSLLVIFFSTLFLTNTFAQHSTQHNLPEGAKARLGKGEINDIQLSSDNTRLAVASSIGVWLYDLHTGSETALLTGHTGSVMHVAFSPDGKILASSARDETIRLWNTETGESLLSLRTSPHPIHLKFSADGKTLISQNWNDPLADGSRNDTVYFWDITTGKQLNRLSPNRPKIRLGKDAILPLAADAFVDHTGRVTFAVGKKDGTISIHDGHTGREIRELRVRTDDSSTLPIQPPRPYTYKDKIIEELPFMRWVTGLNFSPDGKTLVSIIDYREARWYNALIRRGGQTERWDVERDGTSRLFEGPMQLRGPIELWDVETGEQLTVLPHGIGVEFLGDGKTLAIIDREHWEFTIWDVATRSEIAKFPKGKHFRFSGDGKTLAIINNDGYAIWDIATRSEIAAHNSVVEWFETSPERFMLSQDGTLLVTADEHGTVAVRETKNAKQLRLVTTGYTKPFTTLAFSHDGKTIASGTSNIQLWDTHTGTKQNTLKAAAYKIAGLAFAPDNVTLTAVTEQEAFITDQEGIMQWDITTGKQVAAHTLPNTSISTSGTHKGLVFTPNSEKLAVNNLDDLWKNRIKSPKRTIDIWDITTDKPPRHLIEFVTVQGPIALTPDGSILASSSNWNDTTDLWSTQTGKQIATLKTPGNWSNDLLVWLGRRHIRTYALAFTHDGGTLAVGNQDKHIQLWNVTDHQHIGSLEGHKYVVCELAFSPDGKTLASGDKGGKIHLWEMPTHQHLTTFDGHKGYIRTLAFSSDGKTLASMSGDEGTIFLWDIP